MTLHRVIAILTDVYGQKDMDTGIPVKVKETKACYLKFDVPGTPQLEALLSN